MDRRDITLLTVRSFHVLYGETCRTTRCDGHKDKEEDKRISARSDTVEGKQVLDILIDKEYGT